MLGDALSFVPRGMRDDIGATTYNVCLTDLNPSRGRYTESDVKYTCNRYEIMVKTLNIPEKIGSRNCNPLQKSNFPGQIISFPERKGSFPERITTSYPIIPKYLTDMGRLPTQ